MVLHKTGRGMSQIPQKPNRLLRAGDTVPSVPGEKPPFQPLHVRAILFNIKTGDQVSVHDFDFNDLEKRIWYNEKLVVWAIHNHHSVELLLKADDGG